MSFHLECAESCSAIDATEADIHRAFDDDDARGEFIILTAPNGDYLQAAGEGDGPYTLEHRTAATGEHIRAVGECTKQQVRDALVAFLCGNEAWRDQHRWEPLETARPDAVEGTCDRCGRVALGRRRWMIYHGIIIPWVDREFHCFRCLRIMRIYAIIGAILAVIAIGAIVGVSLCLMYWP